jgi:autotransporter-associated beta strand protein
LSGPLFGSTGSHRRERFAVRSEFGIMPGDAVLGVERQSQLAGTSHPLEARAPGRLGRGPRRGDAARLAGTPSDRLLPGLSGANAPRLRLLRRRALLLSSCVVLGAALWSPPARARDISTSFAGTLILNDGETLNILATGRIAGEPTAGIIGTQSGTVTNAGTILRGNITSEALFRGIQLNSGLVENLATGSIDAAGHRDASGDFGLASAGISFGASGTVRNAGTIRGNIGIFFERDGAILGANEDTVLRGRIDSGGGTGIFLGDWRGRHGRTVQGRLLNDLVTAANIKGAVGDGIAIGDLNGRTIENTGTIEGWGTRDATLRGAGIAIGSGSGTIINRGTVYGLTGGSNLNDLVNPEDWAIAISNHGGAAGQRVTVVNHGLLRGGAGVLFNGDGALTNTNTGTIDYQANIFGWNPTDIHARTAVVIRGRLLSDLVNDGQIFGQVDVGHLNELAIRNAGTITAKPGGIALVAVRGGSGEVVNTGTIQWGLYGVYVAAASAGVATAVTVRNSGYIDGGVRFDGDGAVGGVGTIGMSGTIIGVSYRAPTTTALDKEFNRAEAVFIGNWRGETDSNNVVRPQGRLLADFSIASTGVIRAWQSSSFGSAISIGDLNDRTIRNAGTVRGNGGGLVFSPLTNPNQIEGGIVIGRGSGLISNTGTITAGGPGVYISNYTPAGQSAASQQVTVENSGTIIGGLSAIRFEGDGAVTGPNGGPVTGLLQGSGTNAVLPATGVIFIGDWRGAVAGDNIARRQGRLLAGLTIGTTGRVTGWTHAVSIGDLNSQTVANHGTISVEGFQRHSGIMVGTGSGWITNTGTIAGVRSGVEVFNYTPAGETPAVQTVTVANSGTISARTAVWFERDGAITGVGSAAVTGVLQGQAEYGIFVGDWRGEPDANNNVRPQGRLLADLENAGSISGSGIAAVAVGNLNGRTILNRGTISGQVGIVIGQGSGQITNRNTITGWQYGINLANYVAAGATGVTQMPSIVNENLGSITATGSNSAVAVRSLGGLELTNSGLISSRVDGVEIRGRGIVNNTGIIRGDAQNRFNSGSAVYFNTTTESGTVINSGTLSGSWTVYFAGPSSTLSNSGVVDALETAVWFRRGANNSLVNSGTITGGQGGDIDASQVNWVTVYGEADMAVTNAEAGRIFARNSNRAVETSGRLTLSNDGVIEVQKPLANNTAAPVWGALGVNVLNGATGRILAASETSAAIAGGSAALFHVDNAGSIRGSVTFQGANDTYILRSTGTQTGLVTGGAGADLFQLDIAAGSSRSFSATGAGGTLGITQFETIRQTGNGLLISTVTLESAVTLVDVQGGTFRNEGAIAAVTGRQLLLSGDATGLVNAAGATIGAPTMAAGGNLRQAVFNDGTITGSISLLGGDDYVSNRGTISGDINLGDGNDSYVWWITTNGTLSNGQSGTITAGNGIDSLLLGIDAGQSVTITNLAGLQPTNAPTGFEAVGKAGEGTLTWRFPDTLNTQGLRVLGGRLILESPVNATLTNTGATDGSGYVQLDGPGSVLDNRSVLFAGDRFEMRADQTTLINTGTITVRDGGAGTITGDAGRQTIENSGSIRAAVHLGGGADSYTLWETGAQDGVVDGGEGADLFRFHVTGTPRSFAGGDLLNFETIRQTGTGLLTLSGGTLNAATTLVDVQGGTFANQGTLAVATTVGLSGGTTLVNSGRVGGAVTGGQSGVVVANSGTIAGPVTLTGGGNLYLLAASGEQIGHASGGDANPTTANTLRIETAAGGRTLAAGRFVNFQTIHLNQDGTNPGRLALGAAPAPAEATSLDTGGKAGSSIRLHHGELALTHAASSLRAETVTLDAGTTLSGVGSISGGTTTARGTIAPGNSPGTLTFNNLVLTETSLLEFELGQPVSPGGTGGGQFNDLIVVNDRLTVDGDVSVTQSTVAGSNLTVGIYRLIDAPNARLTDATLVDNTLMIRGALPNGLTGSIQVLDNQVNLVVTASGGGGGGGGGSGGSGGSSSSFTPGHYWDGQQLAADNVVNGGRGMWGSNRTNWTSETGAAQGSWAGDFAIFQGTPDTVTVETGYRPVFQQLQFAVGGYLIQGSQLGIVGPAEINVTGAFDATIASVIDGAGALEKDGIGRLILTGVNTYTGLTTIAQGTLALEGSGSIAASSGVVVDANGTFDIAATDAGASITTLSGSGNVALGARTLTLTNASGTFSGVIAGTGGLTLSAGTQTLTGTNTYTGATTIASGATLALSGAGSIAASSGVVVNANGAFDIAATDAGASITTLSGSGNVALGARTLTLTNALSTFSGVIAGTGGLTLSAGTETLTGTNTYTGATTIASGATLSIGAGGTSGSISSASAVTNNGVLTLNRSDVVTFANVVTGTGELRQVGSGTTTLTGANTYNGITSISAGVLVVGSGTVGTLGTGNVVNTASLHFARTDSVTVANAISGTGSVRQIGSGTTNLTGTSTYTGATTVEAGTLRVNGSIASSSVTVQRGGTLGGAGIVGPTTVLAGGTLAPGNSIGTLSINGNLTLEPGASYQLEFSGVAADRADAPGTIVVGGVLDVITIDPPYGLGTRQTILAAQGSPITGAFTAVTGPSGGAMTGLRFDTLYDPQNVDLVVTPASYADLSAVGISLSTNKVSVGRGLDVVRPPAGTRLAGAEKAMFDRLYPLSAPSVARALTELSGEVHTAAAPAASRAASLFGQTMLDASGSGRLRPLCAAPGMPNPDTRDSNLAVVCSRPGDFSIWVAPFASSGQAGGDARIGSGDRNEQVVGTAAGVDVVTPDGSVVGFGLAAGNARAQLSGGRGRFSGDFLQLGVWGLTQLGRFELGASAGYSFMEADTKRDMSTLGVSSVRADYHVTTGFVRLQGVYSLFEDRNVRFGPYAMVEGMNSNRGNFSERLPAGTHPSGVSAGSRNSMTANSELGLQASGSTTLDGSPVVGFFRVGWRAGLARDEEYAGSFTDLPNGQFTIAGARQDDHAAAFAAGVDVPIMPNVLVGGRINGEVGPNSSFIAGTLRLRFEF